MATLDPPPYGVAEALDATVALATRPVFGKLPAWDGVYRFALGAAELELPDDDRGLRDAVLRIYLATGMDGIVSAWNAADTALDRFATPDAAERAGGTRSGGSATRSEDEQREIDILSRHAGVASRATVAAARAHNAGFRRRLLAVIDNLLIAVEEAQRWYETKLHQVIQAQLRYQKKRIEQAWKAYDIGDPAVAGPAGFVPIENADRAGELAIRTRQDVVKIVRYAAGVGIKDSVPKPAAVAAVVRALHEVGLCYRAYRRDLQDRIAANKARRRENAAILAIDQIPSYAAFVAALRKHSATHFIVAAAFRDVVTVAGDETLTPDVEKRCGGLVITALRRAWKNCDTVAANTKADRLFVDDRAAAVVGRDGMGVPATETVVEAVYRTRSALDFVAPVVDKPPPPVPPISRSPWLQAPFHALMMTTARVIATSANAPEPPVEHLLELFDDGDDRRRLLGMRAFPSLVARARDDMIAALIRRQELDEKLRRSIAQAVGLLGLIAYPATGGTSAVVAGLIDAALVADRSAGEIARWIAANQYSALAVDVLTAEVWREPTVSELVAIVLEAGFEIAGDLINEGVVADLFAAVAVVELLGVGADLAIGALSRSGRTR